MESVDLLLTNITQLVTCAGSGAPKRGAAMRDLGIIEGAALAAQDGVIVAVGKSEDLLRIYRSENHEDCRRRAVIPGFVDCHTHAIFAGNRLDEFEMRLSGATYMEIMAAGGGIRKTMRATRAASLDDLRETLLERIERMMQTGTTTAEIKTGYGLDVETEVRLLEVIDWAAERYPMRLLPTFLGAHAVPPEFPDAESYTRHVIEVMLPAVRAWYAASWFARQGTPLFVDVFCEQGVFDVDQARRILQAGQALGMAAKAHVDEFVNLGGVPMAVALDAVSVDHLDVTPDHELERLAASKTVGIMLPAVNFNLGSHHYGSARRLIDAGGILALATDYNPGSAPTTSIPMTMAIACRYQKLTPAEALNAVTLNAAYAIGMGGRIGSIEVGKQADLLILNEPDYRAAAYEFGGNPIWRVGAKGALLWHSW
ncbi:MAG: imidazolonepropionase [Anaerolineae bacterium]|nr:imidazolonepropionase [Anaerolineae bacterium]NUQ04306.1 imidazolonepropionase [Anaerolineae bacterium]